MADLMKHDILHMVRRLMFVDLRHIVLSIEQIDGNDRKKIDLHTNIEGLITPMQLC